MEIETSAARSELKLTVSTRQQATSWRRDDVLAGILRSRGLDGFRSIQARRILVTWPTRVILPHAARLKYPTRQRFSNRSSGDEQQS